MGTWGVHSAPAVTMVRGAVHRSVESRGHCFSLILGSPMRQVGRAWVGRVIWSLSAWPLEVPFLVFDMFPHPHSWTA
jgi:hypothetical protein